MRRASRILLALIMSIGIGGWFLRAQTPRASEKADAPATAVRPPRVDILALQVSKLPRNEFGQGIKPGTNETVAFWLANSGTALDLRLVLDRQIVRFDEEASRLIEFVDDKGTDLTRPPDGVHVNTFFADNKPIIVKLGPKREEAEVVLRGYRTPAPGGTKLKVHAQLTFEVGSGEQTAERKDLEPKPGTEATIGPLHLTFLDPGQVRAPENPLFRRGGGGAGSMQIAFQYEPPEKSIKSLTCLNAKGRVIATLEGRSFANERGGTVTLDIPKTARIHLRVAYLEKSEVMTVPIRLETGVGF